MNPQVERRIPDVETPEDLVAGELTAFHFDLLTAVAHGSGSGADLKHRLESWHYGEDEVNHGRLYPNLDILVECDLIEKGEIDRRTNGYEITEKGLRVLDSRSEWFDGGVRSVKGDGVR